MRDDTIDVVWPVEEVAVDFRAVIGCGPEEPGTVIDG